MKLDFSALKNLNKPGSLDFKNMSANQKKEMLLVSAAFVLFTGLAVFSMMNFVWLNSMSEGDVPAEMVTPTSPGRNRDEIDGITNAYDSYVKYRTFSGQMVTLASSVGRYPIAEGASLAPEVPVEQVLVETVPPSMTIKALVVLGADGAATVDIDSEKAGMVVHKGSTFDGGKGKITAIDAGGVSWTWSGKKYRTNL